jgi:hypothetical protein
VAHLYLDVEPHGGCCCGMAHLFNFDSDEKPDQIDEERFLRSLERAKEEGGMIRGCVEVVLVDGQMPIFATMLRRHGFKRVNRFLNANSGNYCNVLHLNYGQPDVPDRKRRKLFPQMKGF